MKFFEPPCANKIEGQFPPLPKRTRLPIVVFTILWLLVVGAGMSVIWGYENTPGVAAKPPNSWPVDSRIRRAPDEFTLVMLAHPHCPCTRASISELASLMAHSRGRLTAYVLFLKPAGFSEDWEKTDLWRSAASIPGVTPVIDDEGAEARRFRAATSGQTMLYGAGGDLLFSGGITMARGHAGDNAGESAILSLVNSGVAEQTETPAFGCPLFDKNSDCQNASHEKN